MKQILGSLIHSKTFTYGEFSSILSEVEAMLYSHLYNEQSNLDPDSRFSLNPDHVLGSRASYSKLGVDYTNNSSIEQWISSLLLRVSGKKFQNIILPHCVKANKWIG